jgi:hypothetical protein
LGPEGFGVLPNYSSSLSGSLDSALESQKRRLRSFLVVARQIAKHAHKIWALLVPAHIRPRDNSSCLNETTDRKCSCKHAESSASPLEYSSCKLYNLKYAAYLEHKGGVDDDAISKH